MHMNEPEAFCILVRYVSSDSCCRLG
jgi:hypothetical protein